MHHPMKLLCSFLLALGLVGCGGGSSSPVVEETIAVIPPDTSGLVLKMENAFTKRFDSRLRVYPSRPDEPDNCRLVIPCLNTRLPAMIFAHSLRRR